MEEDIITIHLGTVVSQKKYDEIVNYLIECLNKRYPNLSQEVS